MGAQRRRGETFSLIDSNLHRCRRSTPARALSNGGISWSPWRRVSVVREGGEGEANERQGRAPEGVWGFIWSGWSRCRVHLHDHGWARGAAFLERRCELGASLGVARSGVHWFGRGAGVFRMVTCETVRGAASWVSYGTRQWWRCKVGTMPCTFMCGARRMVEGVHGDAYAALGIPWHCRARAEWGQGEAYGRFGRQGPIGRAGWW
jgi:hypothetical protein